MRRTVNIKFFSLFIFISLLTTPLVSANLQREKTLTKTFEKNDISSDFLFDLSIRITMIAGRIPSVTAGIIQDETLIWDDGYGYYDFQGFKQPNKHTIYQVASVSKTVTATAILQLYEQGLFSLDDDVNEFLPFSLRNPAYPGTPITFRMLLSHHASLHDHDQITAYEYFEGNYSLSYLSELLDPNGTDFHPEFWGENKPGTGGNYSNIGFTILGYLVELLSGQSLEFYCQQHIFQPLQMYNTSFVLESLNQDQIAGQYLRFGRIYLKIPFVDYTFLDPCGGLLSSVEDLSHFLIAHMNQGLYQDVRILKESTIKEMHHIQYPNSAAYYGILRFGLGWLIFEEEFGINAHGHDGDIGFSHARLRIFGANHSAIIYLFNKGFRPSVLPRIIPTLVENQADKTIRKQLYQKAQEEM